MRQPAISRARLSWRESPDQKFGGQLCCTQASSLTLFCGFSRHVLVHCSSREVHCAGQCRADMIDVPMQVRLSRSVTENLLSAPGGRPGVRNKVAAVEERFLNAERFKSAHLVRGYGRRSGK